MSRVDRLIGADIGGGPLEAVLARVIEDLAAGEAASLVAAGAVFVDGKRARDARQPVEVGARIVLHRGARAVLAPLVVLFEDKDIVVLDKAPGDHLNETETSSRAAIVERIPGAFVVHRLDRETSGVVALAKNVRMAERLSAAFRERRVEKHYLAIVEGMLADGELTEAIGVDRRRPRARRVRSDGRPARTSVRTLGRLEGLSAIEASPHTGRTHQIRVHLAHHGAPILGDRLYGGPMVVRLRDEVIEVPRTLLHAGRLVLPGWPPFRAAVPEDMAVFARRGLAIE